MAYVTEDARNTTDRLLAGMAKMLAFPNPALSATADTSSSRRMPQRSSRRRRLPSKASLLGAVVTPARKKGSVKNKRRVRRQNARGALEKGVRRFPGRDVDHVDRHDGVRSHHRPSF